MSTKRSAASTLNTGLSLPRTRSVGHEMRRTSIHRRSKSAVPLLMGKITTGAIFSWLLTRYCPAEGPRDTVTMWGIVGGLVLMAPLLLLVLRPFIRMREEGKE